jgi:hypothetical protein
MARSIYSFMVKAITFRRRMLEVFRELEKNLQTSMRENENLKLVVDEQAREINRSSARHRPKTQLRGSPQFIEQSSFPDDRDLIERIVRAYRLANVTPLGAAESMWLTSIADLKQNIHDVLMGGNVEEIAPIFRNPASSALFYGFENTYSSDLPREKTLEDFWGFEASYDALRGIGEAIGILRIENPENFYFGSMVNPVSTDDLIDILEGHFGFQIVFPNPYAEEYGLKTKRGVASYRAIQGLFQAHRIHELIHRNSNARIVEIGGGLGRTAFYAALFGLSNYTLIDLPMTAAAQAYFLGRSLGEDRICLFGEDRPGIQIVPPSAFSGSDDYFDLVVNIDSLTEMARDTADQYCAAMQRRSTKFLSVNHEANNFTVHQVMKDIGLSASSRTPYWLRRGYVEEIFDLNNR